jgi:phosphatidylserine/phosphatidylglycerophosphate/cardiolipin synthase-like enzyme/uncharacterized membrane protein YdjX (TVP38/TMEM64 family)
LHIHILCWDFALFYALEREWFTRHRFAHPSSRLRFEMDGKHPVGASHHQKVVVIDDAVAFAGGLDLTRRRWDTRAHRPDDDRRTDPSGSSYGPYHDVQMAVDGKVAEALGLLARRRWERATGERLHAESVKSEDPWPEHVRPDFRDIDVGIARTIPRDSGQQEVREVERINLDAIGAARRWIYCENQYLTSAEIARALAASLSEPAGPEVLIVAPSGTRGWLESRTMGVLRSRFVNRLEKADAYGRLKICYPTVGSGKKRDVMVHAKVLAVDDRYLRIGSSNLSNRSMGLDTECDLVIEAEGSPETSRRIARIRNGLLGEHLGRTAEEIDAALGDNGSMLRTVEAMGTRGRSLEELDAGMPETLQRLVPESAAFDPERPLPPEEFLKWYFREADKNGGRGRPAWIAIAATAVLLALAAAWRWTPLGEWLSAGALHSGLEQIRSLPFLPVIVLAAYLAGGLLVFPLTVLVIATGMAFGPAAGFAYAMTGSLLSGAVTFAIGRLLGREILQRVAGDRVGKISRKLARSGVLTVFAVRVVPLAPYTFVNMVLGASHISFKDFLLGTALGLLPGIAAITLLGDRLGELLERQNLWTLSSAVMVLLLSIGGLLLLRRKFAPDGSDDGA